MKSNTLSVIILFIVGIALVAVCFPIIKSINDFKKVAVPITAVISDIKIYSGNDDEINHDVYVNYYYEDELFKNIYINVYYSGMFVEKEIDIYVNTNKPSEAKYISYIPIYFIGGIGMILIFSGTGIIVRCKNR